MKAVRRTRALVVTALMALAMVVAAAVPAQAAVIVISDGFEGNPASVWHVERYGISNGGFDIGAGVARTGRNNAWLTASTDFSAVGRNVAFSSYRIGWGCSAGIWVRPLGGVSTLNFEVINPATWTGTWYTHTLTGTGWRLISSPSWRMTEGAKFIRVSLIGNGRSQGILLDDFNASCAG